MTLLLEIRRAGAGDLPALAQVFWLSVHQGAAPKYSAAQRAAWLPARPDPAEWAALLAPQVVFVSQVAGSLTGFMTLCDDGRLDLAYVLPEVCGNGTADALLAMVQNHALASGMTCLTARASDMARPLFLRSGWTVVRPAPQVRGGVDIPATEMICKLSVAPCATGVAA